MRRVNMKHLSLTARMSLMFMSAVIAVLTVAGLSFNMLSQHHFKMLDRQALVEKLESAKHILNNARGEASLSEELPQLRALLGAHQDLAATILASDGSVLFSAPEQSKYQSVSDVKMSRACGSGRTANTCTAA